MLDKFLFADDMAKGAPTEDKMQKGVDQVSDSCDSYDLTISIKKTEVVYQTAPGMPYKEHSLLPLLQDWQLQVSCGRVFNCWLTAYCISMPPLFLLARFIKKKKKKKKKNAVPHSISHRPDS